MNSFCNILCTEIVSKFFPLQLAVKAKGSKSQGTMYVEAEKSREEASGAVIKSIEFELERPRGRIKLR